MAIVVSLHSYLRTLTVYSSEPCPTIITVDVNVELKVPQNFILTNVSLSEGYTFFFYIFYWGCENYSFYWTKFESKVFVILIETDDFRFYTFAFMPWLNWLFFWQNVSRFCKLFITWAKFLKPFAERAFHFSFSYSNCLIDIC